MSATARETSPPRWRRRPLLLASAAALLARPAVAVAEAPGFAWPTLPLMDGSVLQPQDWSDMAGVVVFFATWCPFCARHNPHVQKLHEAVAGKRLRVLGAALDADPAVVRAYLQRNRYTFPVTPKGAELRSRLTMRPGLPLTVPFDRAGHMQPPIPGEMFLEDVMDLAQLAERAAAVRRV